MYYLCTVSKWITKRIQRKGNKYRAILKEITQIKQQ